MGTAFAVGACTSARLRDKDDYKNAAVGGMLAGSIFGFKSTCVCVRACVYVCACMYVHVILFIPHTVDREIFVVTIFS